MKITDDDVLIHLKTIRKLPEGEGEKYLNSLSEDMQEACHKFVLKCSPIFGKQLTPWADD